MNRAALMRVVELSHATAHAANVAAAYSEQDQAKARQYIQHAEDALYAALDALSEAGSSAPPSFFGIACEITQEEIAA